MDKKKKSHGGKRKGAGRPQADDPAVQVSFYTKKSRVEKLGKEKTKKVAIEAVEKEYKKVKKK